MRTGDEICLIVVRSDTSHFNPPESFSTSQRVEDFFEASLNVPVSDVAARMEGYMVSGVQGVVRTYTQKLQKDKHDLAELIKDKLRKSVFFCAA